MTRIRTRILSLFLTFALLFSIGLTGALAAPEQSKGGGGGDRGADSTYATFDQIKESTSILIDGTSVVTSNDAGSTTTFGGTLFVAEGGSITADSISGVNIVGKDYSQATTDSRTDNGIAITKDDGDDIVYVGSDTDFYDVDVDGKGTIKSFNSIISLQNEEDVDDTLEGDDGVGLILGTGDAVLNNVYIKTDGMRSPAIYNMEEDSTVVIKNSWFQTSGGKSWHPIFTLLTASTRAALLYGGETWFYNDTIVTQDWGCLSQEGQADIIKTYSINSYLEAYHGGYGAYVLDGNYMYFYGTEMQATDYAIFLCGKVGVDVGTIDEARSDETIVKNMADYDVAIDENDYLVEGGKSLIAATINAIVVHTNGAAGTSVFNVKDSIVTTDTAHGLRTVGVTGEPIHLDISWRWNNADDSKFNSGESWFAMKNMWGSIAVVRSMEADLTFDNSDLYASNNVLLQSIIAYDPNGSTSMYRTSGDAAKEGIVSAYANHNYTGDILHEDYQRQMTVHLENATLNGKIISGTMAAWNAKWDAEHLNAMLVEAGLDTTALTETRIAAIQDALIQDTSYDGDTNKTGVNLTLDTNSKWTVTETSSLGSLTVAEGGSVVAPEGYTLAFYTNCDTSSDLLFYGYENATKLTNLEAGVTYQDVVVVVQPTSSDEPYTAGTSAAAEGADAENAVSLTEGTLVLDGKTITTATAGLSTIQNSGTSILVVRSSSITGGTDGVTAPLSGPPGGLLIAGDTRTTLTLGQSQAFYINSSVTSKNWAALSTDGAEPITVEGQKELALYSYGSAAKTIEGGYGAYSDLFCNLYLFGSSISAAEIGVVSGTYGPVTIGTIADGEKNTALSAQLTDADKALQSDKSAGSVITGGRNALMIHSVSLPPYWVYDGYSQEEIPFYSTQVSVKDSTLTTDLTLDQQVEGYTAEQQAYIDHHAGSVILIKSTNADISLDGTTLLPDAKGTNALIHTVINNDTSFMITVPDGETYPGTTVSMTDMTANGNILNEDYQRDMELALNNTWLTGKILSGTCDDWNALCAASGFTSYIMNADGYNTVHGVKLTLNAGSTWTVTGNSTLTALTIAKGATITAPDGYTAVMTVNGKNTAVSAGSYTGTITLSIAKSDGIAAVAGQPEGNLPQTGTQAFAFTGIFVLMLGLAALSAVVIRRIRISR